MITKTMVMNKRLENFIKYPHETNCEKCKKVFNRVSPSELYTCRECIKKDIEKRIRKMIGLKAK